MKTTTLLLAPAAATALAVAAPAAEPAAVGPQAVQFFLKIDGIVGESADAKHKGDVDVLSFSWGVIAPRDPASGRATGKSSFQDLHLTTRVTSASPKLMLACATGKSYKEAVLSAHRNGDPVDYLVVDLHDVFVTGFESGGVAGSEVPQDSLSLNFAKIEYKIVPVLRTGALGLPVIASFDLVANMVH